MAGILSAVRPDGGAGEQCEDRPPRHSPAWWLQEPGRTPSPRLGSTRSARGVRRPGLIGAEAIRQFLVGELGVKGDNGSKPIKNPRRLIDWIKRFPDWETVIIIRPRTWKHRPWYTTKARLLAWIFSDPWSQREQQRHKRTAPQRPPRPIPLSVPRDPYAGRQQQRYSPPFPDIDLETCIKV